MALDVAVEVAFLGKSFVANITRERLLCGCAVGVGVLVHVRYHGRLALELLATQSTQLLALTGVTLLIT